MPTFDVTSYWFYQRLRKKIVKSYVTIRRKDAFAIAVDENYREIARSTNHAEVLQAVINLAADRENEGLLVFLHDVLEISNDVEIPNVNTLHLTIIGRGSSNRTGIVLKDGARIISKLTAWKDVRLELRHVFISVYQGNYGSSPVDLRFVHLGTSIDVGLYLGEAPGYPPSAVTFDGMSSGDSIFKFGESGGPAEPVTLLHIRIKERRTRGDIFIIRSWFEAQRWSDIEWVIVNNNMIGGYRGIQLLGGAYAIIENVNLFTSKDFGVDFQFQVPDAIMHNVEFFDPSLHSVLYHITPPPGDKCQVTLINPYKQEVGGLIYPPELKVSASVSLRILDAYLRRTGVATLSGDGTTTDFLLGEHGLKVNITDQTKALVKCTPASPDAIAASPVTCYLSDEDGDGIYESVRAKFTNPPPVGNNNVKIVYEVEYIG